MLKNKNPVIVDPMGDPICVGDWERKKQLGSGGFGTVSLWRNKTTKETLAIKKCRWRLENKLTPKQKERWNLEVEMMEKIKHDNIVGYRKMPDVLGKALLVNNPKDVPILSMEYCKLGNLRALLAKPENCCGVCELEVITILNDTSKALKYLHSLNITHRDFKPENVVLQDCHERKNGVIYKLIDLGYAKELGDDTVSFVGTLHYLAPEIFEKQTYDKSVDYWSFGITAFEIICGIRPFLPTYSVVESFKEVKRKPSDVICIQYTHTGDMKASKELLRENSINIHLKQDLEKWFRSVLQYESEKRGLFDNNNVNVFDRLQETLSKKIVTVFSIYTYKFYSYEVDEGTLRSTLQDWISRDIKVSKTDQILIPSKIVKSNYVLDYSTEDDPEPIFFIFKKDASINKNVCADLPRLIRTFFEDADTEFKFGTFLQFHAHVIYFISQETKHFKALINGICCLYDFLKSVQTEESKLFADIKDMLKKLLSEIEFYNKLETSLNIKMYKQAKNNNNNAKLNGYLLEYEGYMRQVEEIVNVVNAVSIRHKKTVTRIRLLHHETDSVLDNLKGFNFDELFEQAVRCYDEITKTNLIRDLTGSMLISNVIESTIKIRDTVIRCDMMKNLFNASTKYWKELNKLISGMKGIYGSITKLKDNVRQNIMKRLEILQDKEYNVVNIPTSTETLINENISLRYEIQEFMNASFLKYKSSLKVDEENYLVNHFESVISKVQDTAIDTNNMEALTTASCSNKKHITSSWIS